MQHVIDAVRDVLAAATETNDTFGIWGELPIDDEHPVRYLKTRLGLSETEERVLWVLIGVVQDATVNLSGRGHESKISGRHRGDWYDKDWMDTPEFAAFWKEALGGEAAFVGPTSRKDRPRRIGGASEADVARSRWTEMVGFASSRKRE